MVDLPELLESVSSMAEPLAAQKGLSFELEQASDLTFQTDPMKLRQSASESHFQRGEVHRRGRSRWAAERSDGRVLVTVKDTGVGVEPKASRENLRALLAGGADTTRRSGGTGLGLAVTRQFVDLLGGNISVESELGKGSMFRV